MPDDTEKLVLIDGYSLVHRAFFALPPLQNAEGQPTNAVYGFLNMLLKLLDDERPTHVAVAFDASGPTFRDGLYAAYKAHRPDTPDELRGQFPLVREALDVLGIPVIERSGYEADDVIGTLARRARRDGFEVLIVTGDKDLLQLVADGVKALITRRGISDLRVYDPDAIRGQYGLEPDRLVDVKALMGDASDNIPGVPGVGEKTALKLIQRFGSVEGVLASADRVGGKKLPALLRRYAEVARDSKRLATIVTDVPIDVAWETCRRGEPDPERARALFGRLEFRSLLDRLGVDRVDRVRTGEEEVDVALVRSASELAGAFEAIRRADRIGVTYRLAGDDARYAPVAYLSFAAGGRAWVLIGRDGTGDGRDLGEREILQVFEAALERARAGGARLVVHDVKPLLRRCLRSGLWESCPEILSGAPLLFDTLVAAYLLDPSRTGYRLSELARQFAGADVPEPEDLLAAKQRKGSGQPSLARYDLDGLARIAGRQSGLLDEIADALEAEIDARRMGELWREIEAPLIEVLAAMEHAGIVVDREALRAMGVEFTARIERLAGEIHELAGVEFNINSTQQLGEVLFERLGLPVIKKTKTRYSTDADVLEQLAVEHPIARKILEHRSLVKLMGTYVDGMAQEIEPDARIHTTFQQTVAATGRLASTSPNLQNIPIREEPGRKLRKVFRAGDGQKLLGADYSQIELRVLAHMSGDEKLIEAFRRSDDIHTRTAAEVFGVDPEEVTPGQRSAAKAVNFGIVYGISDFGLSRQLKIPRDEARRYIEAYFERYEGVRRYIDEIVGRARREGYVTTLFHRIRYLPDIKSRVFHRRSFAERTAMNTPIQGTAADIIKAAMVRVYRRLCREGWRARLVLQVHDELILEVPVEEQEPVAQLVVAEMTGAADLAVDLVVDVKVGPNWYEMKPLESARA